MSLNGPNSFFLIRSRLRYLAVVAPLSPPQSHTQSLFSVVFGAVSVHTHGAYKRKLFFRREQPFTSPEKPRPATNIFPFFMISSNLSETFSSRIRESVAPFSSRAAPYTAPCKLAPPRICHYLPQPRPFRARRVHHAMRRGGCPFLRNNVFGSCRTRHCIAWPPPTRLAVRARLARHALRMAPLRTTRV